MNRCRFEKELSAYLDNQFSEKKLLKVKEHIKECKICADELMRLEALSIKLKNWQVLEASRSIDAGVQDKIVSWELEKGDVKMKRKTMAVLVPSGVLAGILVFLFVGVHFKNIGYQGSLKESSEKMGDQYSHQYSRGDLKVVDEIRLARGANTESLSAFDVRSSDLGVASQSAYPASKSVYLRAEGGERAQARWAAEQVSSPGESYLNPEGQGPVIVIQPGLPATGQGEKIIRTGSITIEVENGKETYKRISGLCQELEGYLASSRFYRDSEDREAGTITLRVPKDKFIVALDQLGSLGKVQDINTDSKDVNQEYANLSSQLDAAMVVYKKMLEALQKKQVTISEAMRLESEITPVLSRVQDLKNKIEHLNNLISYTTITVNFYEARASVKALKDSSRFIRESMLTAGIGAVRFLAKALPVLVVLIVVVITLVVVAIFIKNWINRFLKRG